MTARLTRWPVLACAAVLLLGGAGCTSNSADPATSTAVTTASASVSATGPTSSAATTSSSSVVTPSVASPTTASPTESASLSPAAREKADRAAVEAQWLKYWDIYINIVRTAPDERAPLAKTVAVDPARSNLSKSAEYFELKGRDTYGSVTHRLSWLDPISDSTETVLSDCQDQSKFGAIDTKTGQKLTVGVERDNLKARFAKGLDGVWRVKAIYILDTPC